jgi:hypothetical protein
MISLQTSLASLLFLVAALAAPIDMSQHEDADVVGHLFTLLEQCCLT